MKFIQYLQLVYICLTLGLLSENSNFCDGSFSSGHTTNIKSSWHPPNVITDVYVYLTSKFMVANSKMVTLSSATANQTIAEGWSVCFNLAWKSDAPKYGHFRVHVKYIRTQSSRLRPLRETHFSRSFSWISL